jgi:uncharacterized protein (DUF1684 family)
MMIRSSRTARWGLATFLLSFFLGLSPRAGVDDGAQELKFRQDREAWMRSERSPLALAGLFWLKPGSNSFGTDVSNDIVLPHETAPEKVGRLILSGGQVQVVVDNPAAHLTLGKEAIQNRILKSDSGRDPPEVVQLGDLRLKIIQRGDRLALRLIHVKNLPLLAFTHLDFFEIDQTYKVEGRFVPYQPHKKIKITSVIGQVEEMDCPGIAQFALAGKNLTMEPILESPDANELFFIFKDLTNGKETYPGGRFLYSSLPQGNQVTLDFNQAHNPYCAYSSFSTCPLPPLQNWLKVPIRAGEKVYSHP